MPKFNQLKKHQLLPGDIEDPRPGAYYVVVVNGQYFSLAAGPYPTHAQAKAMIPEVRRILVERDLWAEFYAYWTARCEESAGLGRLHELGLLPLESPDTDRGKESAA